jgi:hypothetical protein
MIEKSIRDREDWDDYYPNGVRKTDEYISFKMKLRDKLLFFDIAFDIDIYKSLECDINIKRVESYNNDKVDIDLNNTEVKKLLLNIININL